MERARGTGRHLPRCRLAGTPKVGSAVRVLAVAKALDIAIASAPQSLPLVNGRPTDDTTLSVVRVGGYGRGETISYRYPSGEQPYALQK